VGYAAAHAIRSCRDWKYVFSGRFDLYEDISEGLLCVHGIPDQEIVENFTLTPPPAVVARCRAEVKMHFPTLHFRECPMVTATRVAVMEYLAKNIRKWFPDKDYRIEQFAAWCPLLAQACFSPDESELAAAYVDRSRAARRMRRRMEAAERPLTFLQRLFRPARDAPTRPQE
jgi:hypothetical protein